MYDIWADTSHNLVSLRDYVGGSNETYAYEAYNPNSDDEVGTVNASKLDLDEFTEVEVFFWNVQYIASTTISRLDGGAVTVSGSTEMLTTTGGLMHISVKTGACFREKQRERRMLTSTPITTRF